jgi:hypothetical protein
MLININMRDFITTASSFAGMPTDTLAHIDTQNPDCPHAQLQIASQRNELHQLLKKKLFKVCKQKKGDEVFLNPAHLKDLYRLIILSLTPSERSQIAIYELQTFIIEQCIKPPEE